MAGLLLHSPADIIRRLLIAEGYGVDPPSTPWPIYVAVEPSLPDNVITIQDYGAARMQGRRMHDGRQLMMHSIQVRVRGKDHPTGYPKANAIAVALDEVIYWDSVTIGAQSYCVDTVSRLSDVMAMGREETTTRHIFLINALVEVRLSS